MSSSAPRSSARCRPGGNDSNSLRASWTSGSSELGGGTLICIAVLGSTAWS